MKKLADISAFESLGVQNTAADVSVFNGRLTASVFTDIQANEDVAFKEHWEAERWGRLFGWSVARHALLEWHPENWPWDDLISTLTDEIKDVVKAHNRRYYPGQFDSSVAIWYAKKKMTEDILASDKCPVDAPGRFEDDYPDDVYKEG